MTDPGIDLTEMGAAFAAASAASASIGTFMWRLLKPQIDNMFKARDEALDAQAKIILGLESQLEALVLVDEGQARAMSTASSVHNELRRQHEDLFNSFKQYKVDDEKAARALREELADRIRDVGNKLYAHVAQPIKDIERLKGLAGIKPNGN